jgi:non-heme chloroperoxidase
MPIARRCESREVLSGDGTRLHVRTGGHAGGRPIVFLHGYSQSHLSWAKQFAGPLAREFFLVAPDLRGHGWSDKPDEKAAYREASRWAGDVHAVIDRLALERPVLVAWSYAGRIVTDYLAEHGAARLRGIVFVAPAISDESENLGVDIALVGATAARDPVEAVGAPRRFLHACFAAEPPRDDFETMLAYNAMVPPRVRSYVLGRSVDARDVLAALEVPALFVHGALDRIIAPAMSRYACGLARRADVSIYAGVGHSPFYEEPGRFDRELGAFVRTCA